MIFLKRFESFRRKKNESQALKRMSELGLELREALLEDEWRIEEHKIVHVASDVKLWIANGPKYFTVYDIGNEPHPHSYYENTLNEDDKFVLWNLYMELKRFAEQKPAQLVLNHLRLGRIKEHGENK